MNHPTDSTSPNLKNPEEVNEEGSTCCDNPKISKEDGFFVCLNCGFVNSRVLLEAGGGDPTLLEDDPWVEKCGYYDREKLNNSGPNSNDSFDDNPRKTFTLPLQKEKP